MKFKCFYNIARVLALYVSLSRNEKKSLSTHGREHFFA